jgi:pyruvate/2-oxoglutarate/acetoin dehydrogenase E1 component
VPDVPIPYSRVLEQAVIPQVQDLVQAVRDTLAADFERHGRATADA